MILLVLRNFWRHWLRIRVYNLKIANGKFNITDQNANNYWIWMIRLVLFLTVLDIFKRRLNILSLPLSWALWCCLCRTHVIFNRVEPPLNNESVNSTFKNKKWPDQNGWPKSNLGEIQYMGANSWHYWL